MQNVMNMVIVRYEKGKQTITLVMILFIIAGFFMEIITFRKIYLPLQFYLQIFSVTVFFFSLLLHFIYNKRFYVLAYLILSYFLIANIVVYDILFPEFIEKLNFQRSEFFSRNLFFLLPFIAIVGFITDKKHIVIQGSIVLLYILFQVFANADVFIKASALNYILTTIGFCLVIYFLVGSNKLFISDLNESNKQLKEAQQSLVQAEKMASLGILTAGVAHEINNPLNFIQGGVTGLEEYFIETKQEKEEHIMLFMNGINTGIERVTAIVKGLNQFSRDTNYNKESCDIHAILNNTLLILNGQLKDRIHVHRNYSTDSFSITGNVGKLHQVFLNILTNSSQAISEKGEISISTLVDSDRLQIKITDTGCGIPAGNISKVIEPFYTTKDPGKGTGLGLSISYAIIKEHHGELFIKSEINKGTDITIILPTSQLI